MRKLLLPAWPMVALCAAFASCSEPQAPVKSEVIIDDSSTSLAEYDIPASILLPEGLTDEYQLNVQKQIGSGYAVLSLGEDFRLMMRRENTPLDQYRSDMEEDVVFDYEFFKDEANMIYAKSSLPDGTIFSHRVIAQKDFGHGKWVIQSDPTAEVNMINADKMVSAIESMKPVQQLLADQ